MSRRPDDILVEVTPAVRAFVDSLLKRLDDLEARLNQTPQNSSRPPSTQHPNAKVPPERRKSKKNQGGQPGHRKSERSLIPTPDCTAVITVKPRACRRCGSKLTGTDESPLRHQVWELPEIKPVVTEYQQHRLKCSCGTSTCAGFSYEITGDIVDAGDCEECGSITSIIVNSIGTGFCAWSGSNPVISPCDPGQSHVEL